MTAPRPLADLLNLSPGFIVKTLVGTGHFLSDNPVFIQQSARRAEALHKAGLPEE
jgi:hypothetical protein